MTYLTKTLKIVQINEYLSIYIYIYTYHVMSFDYGTIDINELIII